MDAPQVTPPDWDVLRNASERLHQSAQTITAPFQASASIPADFQALSTQLGRLEHQPTHQAEMQQTRTVLAQLVGQMGTLIDKITSLDSKIASLNSKTASLDSKIASLDSKIASLDTTLDTKITVLDEKIDQKFDILGSSMAVLESSLAVLESSIAAMAKNTTASIVNSRLYSETNSIRPLVNPKTNAAIPDFPATPSALSRLSWAQMKILGQQLGLDPPATPASKGPLLAQIRETIGLAPLPAEFVCSTNT